MSKLQCPKCDHKFEINYWKWVLQSPFHTWNSRWTRCPRCFKWSWMKRQK